MGRLVALGLTLIVGALIGAVIVTAGQSAATVPPAANGTTETVTVSATITETVTPEPTDDPNGPKANGEFLVGSQIAPGNWQCNQADQTTNWMMKDTTGDVVDIDFGSVAHVAPTAYTAQFTGCAGTWSLVG